MPVASEIRSQARDHHDVAGAGGDLRLATGAHVRLASLVGLDGMSYLVAEAQGRAHPRKPQAKKAAMRMANPTTMTTSTSDVCFLRKGLKPTARW